MPDNELTPTEDLVYDLLVQGRPTYMELAQAVVALVRKADGHPTYTVTAGNETVTTTVGVKFGGATRERG